MTTISRFEAIASIGRLRVSEFVGRLMRPAVHAFAPTGYKSRVAVLSNWTIAFLGHGRAQRTITNQQVFVREAAEGPGGAGPTRRSCVHA